ncbi:hypothetical protein FB561_6255 [Kribbella amoyensis]|uniref:Secreted protein n=1 Tax=Kribbella amoyensis TaxID=996641 RepID=A0A561B7L5_9ACTN|nr:hypothetical protein [Kribbella amoyensis]TWD74823.1 hypothetical protein FB561_6255 [Kribbella amoyensis]
MSVFSPRIVAAGALVLFGAGIALPTPPAVAHPISATTTQREVCTLDGFAIDHLPDGLGSPSDFQYEWEDVKFVSRVWETGPDPEGATKVDLTVKTVRGAQLTDLETLRTFLTEYHEKDPETWELTATQLGSYGGYVADDQAFFFVEPGVAAEVMIDRGRFAADELVAVASGFHPENAG